MAGRQSAKAAAILPTQDTGEDSRRGVSYALSLVGAAGCGGVLPGGPLCLLSLSVVGFPKLSLFGCLDTLHKHGLVCVDINDNICGA